MEYKILKSSSPLGLMALVQEDLDSGWDIQGNIIVCGRPDKTPSEQYIQAMTRKTQTKGNTSVLRDSK